MPDGAAIQMCKHIVNTMMEQTNVTLASKRGRHVDLNDFHKNQEKRYCNFCSAKTNKQINKQKKHTSILCPF